VPTPTNPLSVESLEPLWTATLPLAPLDVTWWDC